jgi:hypothetical protein
MDPASSASLLSRFSQSLESYADVDGLMLMARAGYHPDFMFALHHLLRARAVENSLSTSDALHPEWASREERLRAVYAAAGHEYERLWPEMSDSPGGIPPVVVSTGEPITRKPVGHATEILIPLRCSNLSGAVEVVLRLRDRNATTQLAATSSPSEWHQLTGCTSDVTQIRFQVAADALPKSSHTLAAIYVADDRGKLVAASSVFSLRR